MNSSAMANGTGAVPVQTSCVTTGAPSHSPGPDDKKSKADVLMPDG